MRNNARDIFKKIFNKPVKAEPSTTELPQQVEEFQPEKEYGLGGINWTNRHWTRYTNQHNQYRSGQAKAVAKRHKANKVARKQRKRNSLV